MRHATLLTGYTAWSVHSLFLYMKPQALRARSAIRYETLTRRQHGGSHGPSFAHPLFKDSSSLDRPLREAKPPSCNTLSACHSAASWPVHHQRGLLGRLQSRVWRGCRGCKDGPSEGVREGEHPKFICWNVPTSNQPYRRGFVERS